MVDEVAKWLEQLDLGRYAAVFSEQQIDREILSELTDEDLEKLGIPLGPRKKLLKAISILDSGIVESPGSLTPGESGTTPRLSAKPDASLAVWERMPGEIYISATTHHLSQRGAEVETHEPISVKGISEPVCVFVLRRLRSAEEAAAQRTRTPFVGRRAESAQLASLMQTCLSSGHGQVIYVRGEPGIGKTRLAEEFARMAELQGLACHKGLVLDFGVGKGEDAIRTLVRGLLDIPLGSGEANRRMAADAAFADGPLEPDQRVYLYDLRTYRTPTTFGLCTTPWTTTSAIEASRKSLRTC